MFVKPLNGRRLYTENICTNNILFCSFNNAMYRFRCLNHFQTGTGNSSHFFFFLIEFEIFIDFRELSKKRHCLM